MSQQSVVSAPESFEIQMDCGCPPTSPGFSLCPPHLVEEEVLRTLRDAPGVYVDSLSAHRIGDGICLHGVVEIDDPLTDVAAIVRRALSIDHVINRMVVRQGHCVACPETDLNQSFMWG